MIEDFLTFTLAQQIPPQCEGQPLVLLGSG